MAKLAWIAAPIVAVLVWMGVRALRGRPVPRFTANVVFALLLLAYLAATTALGVFWVSRMDLPAFDWHYLFGYCVIGLSAVHVAYQSRVLLGFFRRASPPALVLSDRSRFRPWVMWSAACVSGACVVGAVFWFSAGGADRAVVQREDDVTARPVAGATVPRVFVERGGERQAAIDYLHEQSSYSRSGIARRPAVVVTQRPPPFKAYEGHARTALPAPGPQGKRSLGAALWGRMIAAGEGAGAPDLVVAEPADGPMGRADLGVLLHHAAGLTSTRGLQGDVQLRAAASSGALHPTDVYVLSDGVTVGLPAGAYYYHPREHALVRITDAPAQGAGSVTFALAATFDRTVWKYGARSYRYVALDAGHLATNLGLASEALGWRCGIDVTFQDGVLESALGLAADAEGLVALVRCDRRGAATTPAPPIAGPPSLPERADSVELTRLSHRMTSLAWTGTPALGVLAPSPPAQADLLVEDAGADVLATIVRRRSTRTFSTSALPNGVLLGVSRDARWLTPQRWSGNPVELLLVVRRVEGLVPGIYRMDRSGLELLRAGDHSEAMGRAALDQDVVRTASVVLVWTARDDVLGRVVGPRDYRHALFAAGMAGETAYLSATARGAGICGVGAFYDDEVVAALGDAGSGRRVLYLMGMGLPAD